VKDLLIYKPSVLDIKLMQQLVDSEVQNGTILHRSENEMATTIRSYIAIKDKKELIAFVALHIHTITLAEIRSLIVKEEYRGKGLGKQLVNACIDEAKELNLKELLVLTYKKEFFESLGFYEIAKESIPEPKIWADCIKCKHFPICDEISLKLQL